MAVIHHCASESALQRRNQAIVMTGKSTAPVPRVLDLSCLTSISQPALLAHIERVGQVVERRSEGRIRYRFDAPYGAELADLLVALVAWLKESLTGLRMGSGSRAGAVVGRTLGSLTKTP
jgi:hypothetical protein